MHLIEHMYEEIERKGIETYVLCDGDVLYDGSGLLHTIESASCPYEDSMPPHFMRSSIPRADGKRLITIGEPDMDRPGTEVEGGFINLNHLTTIKITEELDDVHKDEGHYLLKYHEDGVIKLHHGLDGIDDVKEGIAFIIDKFLNG